MTDLRYPIGPFTVPARVTTAERAALIGEIAACPERLRRAVASLSDAQLDTPYRPGGWTVRQVVHHVPDSHVNAYVRMKLAVTEDEPTIRTYEEAQWAELPEARTAPPELSLRLLESLHERWTLFLRSLEPAQFERAYRHPQLGRMTLDAGIAMYAWHGRHHVAHVTTLAEREGW
jgi:uncharacterized damage-inducible protein DinB